MVAGGMATVNVSLATGGQYRWEVDRWGRAPSVGVGVGVAAVRYSFLRCDNDEARGMRVKCVLTQPRCH